MLRKKISANLGENDWKTAQWLQTGKINVGKFWALKKKITHFRWWTGSAIGENVNAQDALTGERFCYSKTVKFFSHIANRTFLDSQNG